jgi:phage major head subunit gpT-like protein
MSISSRSTLSYAVDEAVTEVAFAELFEGEPMFWPTLYNVKMSTKKQETRASFGELANWAVKLEGQAMSEQTPKQQFKQSFHHDAYSSMLQVTRELEDDDDWGVVEDFATQLGEKGSETMETKAALVFNDAFDGAYFTGEDGLSLCNDAHLNAESGGSQDNKETLALTFENAKTVRKNMRKHRGYDGSQILVVNPNELLVPVDLEEEAWSLVQSQLKPGTANNDANIFTGRYTVYVWHWLTDTNAWFMMDSRLRNRHLLWYVRFMMEIMADASFSQMVRKIGGYMRWVNGFSRWIWIRGSNPS